MSRIVVNSVFTDPRASQRQVGAWVDRQTHDEFEIIAKKRGLSKAKLAQQIIEEFIRNVEAA